jgi:hypothetical protein
MFMDREISGGKAMSLPVTLMSRCLDKKLVIAGFEVPDLMAIFLFLSILNLLFGWTGMRFVFVWLPTLVLSAALRIGKSGKPDRYLIHLLRYWLHPKYVSAFRESPNYSPIHARLVSATYKTDISKGARL